MDKRRKTCYNNLNEDKIRQKLPDGVYMKKTELSDRQRNILRIIYVLVLCGVLFGAIALEFMLFETKGVELYSKLIADTKKTRAWFLLNIGYALPFITICAVTTLAYLSDRSRRAHIEKAVITAVSSILTYATLIPLAKDMMIATDEKSPERVYMVTWFIRLIIPVVLIIAYQIVRSQDENVGEKATAEDCDAEQDEDLDIIEDD